MNIDFSGRTVLVTGGGHGLGQAMCNSFRELGGQVWTCDLDAGKLEETRALCGGRCETRVVDVRDRRGVSAFVAEAGEASGGVDVLVNNAGGVAGQVGRPLEQVSEEDWQVIFDVNLKGAFNFSQAVVPGMREANRGRIINISSGAGLRVSLDSREAHANPGLRIGQGRPHRIDPATGPRTGAIGDHRELRRPGVRSMQPHDREAVAGLRGRGAGTIVGFHRHPPVGQARGYRLRRDVPCLGLRLLGFRTDAICGRGALAPGR